MTRPNNTSEILSAKSLADLYEKAKACWTEEIQDMLDSMIDGVQNIDDWLLTANEIEQLAGQIASKKGGIKTSFAFQLRKNLNDLKNMRRTRSHKDMVQSWSGADSIAREGPEQNPELKSILQQYSEKYFDVSDTLFQRLQICVGRSDVEEHENPVSVKNLCFSFRNSIDNIQLETKYEAALYRNFGNKVLAELDPLYHKVDDLLVKQGILLDSKPANKSPEIDKQAEAKSSPVQTEVSSKPKDSKNLSEQNPPDSLRISRRFELLSLLNEAKKKSQPNASSFHNIFDDLKKKLNDVGLSEIDKEFDLVSFLFNFVFSNKDLPEETKVQLARLQAYVLISAINETGLIDQADNPAQLLLDTVVKTEIDLIETGRDSLSGTQVLRTGIDRLIGARSVTFKSYADLLNLYQKHIDNLQNKIEQEEQRKKAEEVARLQKILEDEQNRKAQEEARLKKIKAEEEDRRNKIEAEERKKKAGEESRQKKVEAEEEARRNKIETEERKKKTEEEARQKKIEAEEEARRSKIETEDQKRKAEEETRLKKIEDARLQRIEKERQKRVEDEKRLKQEEKDKRQKKIREQDRLKQARIAALKKQQLEKDKNLKIDQSAKIRRLVKSRMEEITIPLLALNKPFILFDKVWSPLLVQIAIADGVKSEIWQKTLRMARNQVWSLIPKSTASELQKLIAIRPHIANSLVRGMHSLKLSASLQKSLVEYLRLEYEEVVKQSNRNIKTLKNKPSANATKPPVRQKVVAKKPLPATDKSPVKNSVPSKDKPDAGFIHDSKDLHFGDSKNKNAYDSEDLIIDDSDDDIIIAGPENLIIEDSDDDTTIEASEDIIIDDIEGFSDSMKTGIYQLSSEMLKALNAVVPGQKSGYSGPTKADSIKQGDWAEIKQGSSKIMAKLTWRSADDSLYIFVDSGGKRVREIDGATLNKEIQSGTMKLVETGSSVSDNSQFSVVK